LDILTLTRRMLLGLVSFSLIINGVLLVLAKHRGASQPVSVNYSLKAYVRNEKEAHALIEKFKGMPFSVIIKSEKRAVGKRIGYDLVFETRAMDPKAIDKVYQYLRNNRILVKKRSEQAIVVDYLFRSEAHAKKYARYLAANRKVVFDVKPRIQEQSTNVYYLEFTKLDRKSVERVRKMLKNKVTDIRQSEY
jgi:hypothetical protein